MNYYVYEKDGYDFAHVIETGYEISHSALTKFDNEDEAWDYAESLSVSAITDDIPDEIYVLINKRARALERGNIQSV